MSTWYKAAAGALIAYFGIGWLDNKFMLSADIKLALKMKPLLTFANVSPCYHSGFLGVVALLLLHLPLLQSHQNSKFTVTDAWYETLTKVNGRKKCLVNSLDGSSFTFAEVEKLSNQASAA